MNRLLLSGALEWYEEDTTVTLLSEDAELSGAISPWYSDDMWHLDMIGAAAAYEQGATGAGVRVGVLDSGIGTARVVIPAVEQEAELMVSDDLLGEAFTDITGFGGGTPSGTGGTFSATDKQCETVGIYIYNDWPGLETYFYDGVELTWSADVPRTFAGSIAFYSKTFEEHNTPYTNKELRQYRTIPGTRTMNVTVTQSMINALATRGGFVNWTSNPGTPGSMKGTIKIKPVFEKIPAKVRIDDGTYGSFEGLTSGEHDYYLGERITLKTVLNDRGQAAGARGIRHGTGAGDKPCHRASRRQAQPGEKRRGLLRRRFRRY